MSTTHEKVKFETNIPVEVSLAYQDGKPINGRFGESVMYTLKDDRVMFVPPIVRDRIAALEIKPDQPFVICKKEIHENGKSTVEWVVTPPAGNDACATLPKVVDDAQQKLVACGLQVLHKEVANTSLCNERPKWKSLTNNLRLVPMEAEMKRRDFFKQAGIGSATLVSFPALAHALTRSALAPSPRDPDGQPADTFSILLFRAHIHMWCMAATLGCPG